MLKKRNIGENDQIVTFYSPSLGKFEATAKGARKIISRLSGHLEILNICDLEIYDGGGRRIITQCQTVNSFKTLKCELEPAMLTFLVAEIFCRMTPSDGQGEDLFSLLLETLSSLGGDKNILILESFKIKLLKACGALGDVSECGDCRHKWREGDKILLDREGNFTCADCSRDYGPETVLDFKIVKLISYISSSGFEKISLIRLTPKEQFELKKICDRLLHTYTEFEPNSEKIARQMSV